MNPPVQGLMLQDSQLWLEEVNLRLRLWTGEYQQTQGIWLRWYGARQSWLPTAVEQAEAERRRAIEATERAENLAAKLRELGVDPDNL